MPEILKNFKNIYMAESKVQFKVEDLTAIDCPMNQVKALTDEVKFLHSFLGAEKSESVFSVCAGAKRSGADSASDLLSESEKKHRALDSTAMDVDEFEQSPKPQN